MTEQIEQADITRPGTPYKERILTIHQVGSLRIPTM